MVVQSWGLRGGGFSVIVHGGAGDVAPEALENHRQGCRAAAEAGRQVLMQGGNAVDAVQRAVEALEDNPCFNAGTGACLNEAGLIELDASIMEGGGLRAGAVGALPPFKNPIAVARAALEDGRHVLYVGAGAEQFALQKGFVRLTSEAMTTEGARKRYAEVHGGGVDGTWAGGTVGAVARDASGLVAAATSTGGLVDKRVGRVGDSPLLGAGNYADSEGGACSTTGWGEGFMRLCLSKTAVDWLRDGMHPEDAARAAIRLLGSRLRGRGGLILVDRRGRLGWARNTKTMTWAAAWEGASDVEVGA